MKLLAIISSASYLVILCLLAIAKIWHYSLYGPTMEMSDVPLPPPLQVLHDTLFWLLLLLVFYSFALAIGLFIGVVILSKRWRVVSLLLITTVLVCLFVVPFTTLPHQEFALWVFFPLFLGILAIFLSEYKKKNPENFGSVLMLSMLLTLNIGIVYFTDLYAWVTG